MPNAFDWFSRVLDLVPTVLDFVRSRLPTRPAPEPVPPREVPAPHPQNLRPATKPGPHHTWRSFYADGQLRMPPVCDRCDVEQTESNRFDPCPGRAIARAGFDD